MYEKNININTEGFKDLIKTFSEPVINIAFFAIPIGIVAYCAVTYLKFLSDDEQAKANNPYFKRIKTVLIAGIIAFLVPTILRLLGIS